ncbi:MAG: hypothetical protein DWH79_00095 [Planctomycetota bacterium]|nr:MAG: hypothetical protein DWH79_00095 [Planctomycetota bacterium]
MHRLPPQKSLDLKLARIVADSSCTDFILADAKDADMAFGLASPGVQRGGDPFRGPFRTMEDFRGSIRALVKQGLVDIMLMSASTSETLSIDEGLFADSHVTPAVRMNDTSDIWLASGSGNYPRQPALPFSTTTIPQAQCGRVDATHAERGRGADLGLFSLTLNDDAGLDRAMLEAYRDFRIDAERAGFRHFLEVFYPNCIDRTPGRPSGERPREERPREIARFLADHVVRTLAGVPRAGRPIFLKIPYLGPEVTEQLAAYDRSLVIGILGGGAGTTHDAFGLLADAKRHGARVALFGRKINAAEDQLLFVKHLRLVADGQVSAEEAVRAYHGDLQTQGIPPHRSLGDDLKRAPTAQAYGG